MIRAFLRDQRGVAAVEAALVAPFLLAITVGAADIGNLLLQRHHMKAGLAAGARLLAHAAAPTAAETSARELAVTGRRSGGTSRVPGWTTAHVSVSYRMVANGSGQYSGPSTIRIVRLQSTFPYVGFGFLRVAALNSLSINTSHEERWTGG